MPLILQSKLPVAAWEQERLRKLPGTVKIAAQEWLQVDECYAEQMAYRVQLLAQAPDKILVASEQSQSACRELLDIVLAQLAEQPGFVVQAGKVHCPDARVVAIDRDNCLTTLGQVIQEDLAILLRGPQEHILHAGIVCFPASWTLAEKFLQPLHAIHGPVQEYDPGIAQRVQRMFDGLPLDRVLMRANTLLYADPELHQPRPVSTPRETPADAPYVRSERQCLCKLPQSQAIVFTIHTSIVARRSLPAAQQASLAEWSQRSPTTP